ncbi:hypothetical protein [Psittacicella hinzii]|uniref:Uncharacterized protein n=1 Tax=Psittacicella hinzii TaxID=2028575 RepID=A0A3A1YKB0_9GAMM|nr:hypothetical protein [Psittacicella hinzii]RIY37906.1 hypothetical protein CKF58_04490 [Psittacicella hinzii]
MALKFTLNFLSSPIKNTLLSAGLMLTLGMPQVMAAPANKNTQNTDAGPKFSLPFVPLDTQLSKPAVNILNNVRFFDVNPKAKGYNARGYINPQSNPDQYPFSAAFNSDARYEPLHQMMVIYYQGLYDYLSKNRVAKDPAKFLLGALDLMVPYDLSNKGKVYRQAAEQALLAVTPAKVKLNPADGYLLKDFILTAYTSQMMGYCNINHKWALQPSYCRGAAIMSIILTNGFKTGQGYFRRLGFLAQIPQEMDYLNDEQKLAAFGTIIPVLATNQETFSRLVGFTMDFGDQVKQALSNTNLTLGQETNSKLQFTDPQAKPADDSNQSNPEDSNPSQQNNTSEDSSADATKNPSTEDTDSKPTVANPEQNPQPSNPKK